MKSALLVNAGPGWAKLSDQLLPGAHVVAIFEDEVLAIEGRCAGLELRDTLLVLSAGPRSRFAFVFRKPIEKTNVPVQMLDTETGGLHIDACRIGSRTDQTARRWPTNILLIHGDCRRIGIKHVRSDGHHPGRRGAAGVWSGEGGGLNGNEGVERYMGADGLESVEAWECVPGCPVGLMDSLSGDRPSTLTGRADPTRTHDNPATAHPPNWLGTRLGGGGQVYADFGGASRFYPQFADEGELHAWLDRLTDG